MSRRPILAFRSDGNNARRRLATHGSSLQRIADRENLGLRNAGSREITAPAVNSNEGVLDRTGDAEIAALPLFRMSHPQKPTDRPLLEAS